MRPGQTQVRADAIATHPTSSTRGCVWSAVPGVLLISLVGFAGIALAR